MIADMIHPNVLILDYSVDKSEASLFRQWFPDGCDSTAVFMHFGEEIPNVGDFSHVMHTGSSLSICSDAGFHTEAARVIHYCVESGIPQMGVCYGHQLLCRVLIGSSAVEKCSNGFEAGWKDVQFIGKGLKIDGVERVSRLFQSHFDRVVALPDGAEIIATSEHTRIQGFIDKTRCLFSLQFHPEFSRKDGNELFRKEKKLLEENGIDVVAVLADGPSINAGMIFFRYFIENILKRKRR